MSPTPLRPSSFLLLVAAAVLAGCGGGGGEPSLPASIALSLSAPTASAAQGASSPVTITLSRSNFAGDVTLTAEGLPAGVTASFSPATLSGTTAASVVTLSAGLAATPGTTVVTVRASGSGVTSQTSAISLTVVAGVTPGYTIALSPTSASLTTGATAAVSVALARTSFTSDVTLSASGVPTGATVSFSPATTSGNASTLTINAGTAAAGSYTLTVTGTATGLAARTASLPVTISTPGAANVTFTFCASALPVWVGYQDGTGAWKQAATGVGNSYSFAITDRGGVAIIDSPNMNPSQSGYQTYIYYASAAELASIGASNCVPPTPGTRTLNGTVAGVGTGDATLALAQTVTDLFADGPFSLTAVQAGAHDLLAVLTSSTTFSATKVIVRRGLDPASGSTLPLLDFGSAEAVAPVRYAVSFPGVATSTAAIVLASYGTPSTTSVALSGDQFTAGSATYVGYPNAAAGDLHEILAEVQEGANDFRGAYSFFTVPGARDAGLGPLLSRPTFSSLGATPYPRLRVQFASQAEYNSVALGHFSQETGTATDRVVTILMTTAYLGAVPATWDLSVPDLTAASGFSSSWLLATGQSTTVAAAAYGGAILTGTPTNGTIYTFGQSYGALSTTPSMASERGIPTSAAQQLRVAQLRAQAARVLHFARNRRAQRMR